MQESLNVLTKEYLKRSWLKELDESILDEFIKDYQDGDQINYGKLRESDKVDEYNLLSWISASSDLKLAILEDYINSHRRDSPKEESSDIKDKMDLLRELQLKVFGDNNEGGFVDEVEPDAGDGRQQRSSITVLDTELDTTGKSLNDQILLYQKALEESLVETLSPEKKQEELSNVCDTFSSTRKEAVEKTVKEEVRQAIEKTKQTGGIQKVLTQQNAA